MLVIGPNGWLGYALRWHPDPPMKTGFQLDLITCGWICALSRIRNLGYRRNTVISKRLFFLLSSCAMYTVCYLTTFYLACISTDFVFRGLKVVQFKWINAFPIERYLSHSTRLSEITVRSSAKENSDQVSYQCSGDVPLRYITNNKQQLVSKCGSLSLTDGGGWAKVSSSILIHK